LNLARRPGLQWGIPYAPGYSLDYIILEGMRAQTNRNFDFNTPCQIVHEKDEDWISEYTCDLFYLKKPCYIWYALCAIIVPCTSMPRCRFLSKHFSSMHFFFVQSFFSHVLSLCQEFYYATKEKKVHMCTHVSQTNRIPKI